MKVIPVKCVVEADFEGVKQFISFILSCDQTNRTYRMKQNRQLNKWARLTIEHIEQNEIDS